MPNGRKYRRSALVRRPIPDERGAMAGCFWRLFWGSPWRDLPAEFGNWNTVFQRFRYWVDRGVFQRIFEALAGDPDMEYAMIDATIVHVHRQAHGAKGGLKIRPSESRRADGQPRSSR